MSAAEGPAPTTRERALTVNRHHLTGATAYISAAVNIPTVRAIPGHPGVYILCFGDDLDLHATAAQWDAIDTAVRNGILAAQTRAVAS